MKTYRILFLLLLLVAACAIRAEGVEISTQLRYRLEQFHRFNEFEKKRAAESGTSLLHSLRADVTAEHEWESGRRGVLQLRAATLNGFDNTDIAFKPDDFARVHQAYLDVPGLFGGPVSLRLGRQELDFGGGLLVNPGDWDHVGNTFDGLRFTTQSRPWTFDAFVTSVSDPSNSVRDGLFGGFSAKHVSRRNTVTEYSLFHNRRPYYQNGDYIDMDLTTLGVRRAGKASPRWTLQAQAHYQFGKTIAFEPILNAAQHQKIRAWHYMLSFDYFVHGRIFQNLGLEYSSGSGDNTGTPGSYETFQQLFPGNHNRFGAMDWFGPMNADIITLYTFYEISPRVLGLVQYHNYQLRSPEAAWFLADGTPAWTTSTGKMTPHGTTAPRDAGTEWDFEWRIRTPGPLTYHLGYSLYTPGTVTSVERWWAGATEKASWAYLQITYDK